MKKIIMSLLIALICVLGLMCLSGCGDEVTTTTTYCAHTEEVISGKAATCTEKGLTDGIKCSKCGEILVEQEIIDELEHTEVTVDGIEPTCTETGLTEGKRCAVCHKVTLKQTVIPVKPHTEADIPGKAATCTQTGLTSGKKCTVCQAITVPQTVIPVSPHKEIDIPAKAATCTKTGLTLGKKCSVCNTVTVPQSVIPVQKHNEITLYPVDATCTESGLTMGKKCTSCHAITLEQSVIPAEGHTEITLNGNPATCTDDGLTDGKICTTCKKITVEQYVIPAEGHKEIILNAVDPTCARDGLSAGKKCSVCNTVTVEQTAIPSTDHTVGEWVDEIPTVCGENGILGHYYCSVCESYLDSNKKILNTIVIPAREEHNYTEWISLEAVGCSSASCNIRLCIKCAHCDADSNAAEAHSFKLYTKAATLTERGYLYRFECDICHTVAAESIIPSTAYEDSPWKGKKWCAIGDSITIRYGNYVDTVANALGLEATNLGIDGADANRMRLSFSGENENYPDYSPSRKKAVMEADLITVYGFANDYYPGAPALGDVYNTEKGTYAYNVKALIEAILELNPTAKIVIIGCHNIWDYYRPDIYEPVNGKNRIADYIEKLDEIANYYGLPFIDMYHDSGINEFSAKKFLADGCHPTPEGYKRISEILIQRLMVL